MLPPAEERCACRAVGERPAMAEDPQQSPPWMRLSGIGVELAAAVAGFTLAGYWWDRHFRSGPWGLLIGIALGLVGGTYNLIRQSLLATKEAGRSHQTTNGDKQR
jgi:F0F1-type ATP synthase assembly protein I